MAKSKAEQDKKKKVCIAMDKDVWRSMRNQACDEGISLSAKINEACKSVKPKR